MGKQKSFWELFIAVMIVLGIAHVFLEDFSQMGGWSVDWRIALVIIGFAIDLIFSIEFIVRTIINLRGRRWGVYFLKERGWVDLLSSLPLLLFCSGPLFLGLVVGGAFGGAGFIAIMNVLRSVRIFRMTRVLRILRVLRFLRLLRLLKLVETHDEDPAEEKRLQAKASAVTITLVTFVLVLMITPFMPKIYFSPEHSLMDQQKHYALILKDWYRSMYSENNARLDYLAAKLSEDPDVLYLYNGATTMINKLKSDEPPIVYMPKNWFYTDYKMIKYQNLKLYYSTKSVEGLNAKLNLLLETIVVLQALALMFLFYRKKKELVPA